MNTGVFPDKMKIKKVLPVLKTCAGWLQTQKKKSKPRYVDFTKAFDTDQVCGTFFKKQVTWPIIRLALIKIIQGNFYIEGTTTIFNTEDHMCKHLPVK